MKDMDQYMGISLNRIKQMRQDGKFICYITVGKQNKVLVDRVAFEKFIEERGHI